MTIRKLVELRIKEFKAIDNPLYFKRIIINALYHLILHLIGNSGNVEMIELKAFNLAFSNLVVKVKIQRSEIILLKRKSHIIGKELRALYSHTFKW